MPISARRGAALLAAVVTASATLSIASGPARAVGDAELPQRSVNHLPNQRPFEQTNQRTNEQPSQSALPAAPMRVADVGSAGVGDSVDDGVRLGRITLSRTRVAASGVATVPVAVTVPVTVTDGQPLDTLTIAFKRLGTPPPGAEPSLYVPLKRVSGTASEGVWRGIAHIGSVHHGTLKVDEARRDWCWICGNLDDRRLPLDGPSIQVRGSHIPRISLTTTPKPVRLSARNATLAARVIDSDTGRPYVKPVRAWFGQGFDCLQWGGLTARVTDRGVARLVLDTKDKSALLTNHCVYLYGPRDAAGEQVPLVSESVNFDATSTISIRPAANSVRAKAPLTIRGAIADANGVDGLSAKVQRLIGRTQWRTMATVPVTNGQYTATIRYGAPGRLTLRAVSEYPVRARSTTTVVTIR